MHDEYPVAFESEKSLATESEGLCGHHIIIVWLWIYIYTYIYSIIILVRRPADHRACSINTTKTTQIYDRLAMNTNSMARLNYATMQGRLELQRFAWDAESKELKGLSSLPSFVYNIARFHPLNFSKMILGLRLLQWWFRDDGDADWIYNDREREHSRRPVRKNNDRERSSWIF